MINFEVKSVTEAINNANSNYSPGPDNIPAFLYRNLLPAIVYPLMLMFNLFMKFGMVPNVWKEAIAVPIFKKGAASKPSNYRPISLTNACCKIFESVILKKLLKFCENNKTFSPAQHGFLKNHSTCTNLLETVNDFTDTLNHSKEALVLYVDFCRAFDFVSIPKL